MVGEELQMRSKYVVPHVGAKPAEPHGRYFPPPNEEGNVRAEIDRYLEALSLRTTSQDTRVTRRSHLQHFERWCAEREITRPAQLTRDLITRFLVECREE